MIKLLLRNSTMTVVMLLITPLIYANCYYRATVWFTTPMIAAIDTNSYITVELIETSPSQQTLQSDSDILGKPYQALVGSGVHWAIDYQSFPDASASGKIRIIALSPYNQKLMYDTSIHPETYCTGNDIEHLTFDASSTTVFQPSS